MESRISLWNIFAVFAKIGAFTIGGGYVMIPAIEAEIRKRNWIEEDELPDIVALSQSAPGLLTVNMAIFAGYRMRGVKGSVAATAGCILAPFLAILLIAMFFSSFRDVAVIEHFFKGVRPVSVALIAAYAVKLFRKNGRWWQWAITAAALAGMVLLKLSPIYMLLTLMVSAAAVQMWRERR